MFEWHKKSKLAEQLKFFGAKKQGFISVYASKPRIRVEVKNPVPLLNGMAGGSGLNAHSGAILNLALGQYAVGGAQRQAMQQAMQQARAAQNQQVGLSYAQKSILSMF